MTKQEAEIIDEITLLWRQVAKEAWAHNQPTVTFLVTLINSKMEKLRDM